MGVLVEKNKDLCDNFKDLTEKHKELAENYEDLAEKYKELTENYQDQSERYKKVTENNKDLAEKNKELAENYKDQAEKHKGLAKKQEDFVQLLRDKVECPVCLDVPRTFPIPVCPNGHVVCTKCVKKECPTCRVKMWYGKSTLAVAIIENIDHECEHEGCQDRFQFWELESHGKTCDYRLVGCPGLKCDKKIALSSLPAHMESCSTCVKKKIESNKMPYVLDFTWPMTNKTRNEDESYVECIRYDGRIFVMKVARRQLDGGEHRWVFMVQIVGGEEEALKYEATIIVYRTGNDSEGKYSQRYYGDICPIDVTTVQAADEKGMCLALTDGAMSKFIVDNGSSMDSLSEKQFSVSLNICVVRT